MTPLRSPAFRWLWASTLGTSGAQGIERTATAWLALEAGGALGVGMTLAARAMPALLFGLAAGAVADRWPRRLVLMAVASLGIPLMVVVAWYVGSGGRTAWGVAAFAFAFGCLRVFDGAARQALVLDAIGFEAAPNAFAQYSFAARVATAIGAALAGMLIATSGLASCYLAVAAGLGFSIVLMWPVRVAPVLPRDFLHPPFWRSLVDAVRLYVDVPAIRILSVLAVAGEVFAFSNATALPVLARDVFATGPEGLGALDAAAAIGGAVVIVLLALLPARVRREPILGATFLVYGAAVLALSASGSQSTAIVVMVVVGACAASFDLLQQMLMQLAVPAAQRGRAAGLWFIGTGSGPIGHLEIGFLIATLGASDALRINGAIVTAAALILLAAAPRYRWWR